MYTHKLNKNHDYEHKAKSKNCSHFSEPIDRQLRNMQKKLQAIANIPLVIQSAIQEVARVLEKFVPPEPQVEEPDSDESDYALTVESLFDESEIMETISQCDYDEDTEVEDSDDQEVVVVVPVLSAEEKERLERAKNIEKVQKAWPWKDEEHPIHKWENYGGFTV